MCLEQPPLFPLLFPLVNKESLWEPGFRVLGMAFRNHRSVQRPQLEVLQRFYTETFTISPSYKAKWSSEKQINSVHFTSLRRKHTSSKAYTLSREYSFPFHWVSCLLGLLPQTSHQALSCYPYDPVGFPKPRPPPHPSQMCERLTITSYKVPLK